MMTDDDTSQTALRRLATSLTHALQIPHAQSDLVFRIGDSRSTNNLEAVQAWIMRQAQQPDSEMARRLLPLLMERLEREITNAN